MKENDNKEVETKAYNANSERAQLQFWNNMRKIENSKKRMEIYGDSLRNELFKRNGNNKHKKEQEKMPDPIIYSQKNNIIFKKSQKKKFPLKYKILIAVLILALIGIMIYLFMPKTPPIPPIPEPKYSKESFVTGLTYKENQIMKFRNIKTTKVNFDFENITTTNSTKTIKEYSDYVIGITKSDKVIENNTEKEIFEGFIFLENYLLDNETNKMLLQNSTIFDDILKKNNLRNLQEIEKKYFNFSLDEIEYISIFH